MHTSPAWRNIPGGGGPGRSKFLHHWAPPDEEPPLGGDGPMLSLAEEVLNLHQENSISQHACTDEHPHQQNSNA